MMPGCRSGNFGDCMGEYGKFSISLVPLYRDLELNPFKPGSRLRPFVLESRDKQIEAFDLLVARSTRCNYDRGMVLSGLRGGVVELSYSAARSMRVPRRQRCAGTASVRLVHAMIPVIACRRGTGGSSKRISAASRILSASRSCTRVLRRMACRGKGATPKPAVISMLWGIPRKSRCISDNDRRLPHDAARYGNVLNCSRVILAPRISNWSNVPSGSSPNAATSSPHLRKHGTCSASSSSTRCRHDGAPIPRSGRLLRNRRVGAFPLHLRAEVGRERRA